MNRSVTCLATLALLSAARLSLGGPNATDGDATLVQPDGKTIVIQSGGPIRTADGVFHPAKAVRVNLQPATRTLEKAAFLGITASTVTPALRSQLKLQQGVGLVVEKVEKGSPAAEAGVETYDVLQQFNDQILIDTRQFGVLVRIAKPGDEVSLKLIRKGEPVTVKAKLTEKDLPPLDDNGLRDIRPWFLEGNELSVEKSDEPFNRAVDMLRRSIDTPGQLRYSDQGMTLEIVQKNGDRRLNARDAKGRVLYNGPINTEVERKSLPPEVAKRLKDMEGPTTKPASGE